MEQNDESVDWTGPMMMMIWSSSFLQTFYLNKKKKKHSKRVARVLCTQLMAVLRRIHRNLSASSYSVKLFLTRRRRTYVPSEASLGKEKTTLDSDLTPPSNPVGQKYIPPPFNLLCVIHILEDS